MASNALTTEAIALTEKKMDMSLDDIIKMSKKPTPKGKMPPRVLNKNREFLNGGSSQDNLNIQRFMQSRSSIRQGVLAQRRSNPRGNQFPLSTEVASRAGAVSIRNTTVNRNKLRVAASSVQRNSIQGGYAGEDKMVPKKRPQTMDALFADMKEQRKRKMSQQMSRGTGHQTAPQRRLQKPRGRGVAASHSGLGRQFGSFAK